jgi:hypothetical protein
LPVRLITAFHLPFNGRNFGGMLSHVFLPMTTAFMRRAAEGFDEDREEEDSVVTVPHGGIHH